MNQMNANTTFSVDTMNSSSACEPSADAAFGPAIAETCRGGFDFTMVFEQSLIIIPASLLLLAAPLRLSHLSHSPALPYAGGRALQWLKLIVIAVLAVLQLATLALWATHSGPALVDHVALSATCLSFASSLVALLLSYAEHTRSPRPSSLLNMFLLISLLIDVTVVRSVWLSSFVDDSIRGVITASLVLKTAVLILEAVEKRRYLSGTYTHEATAGLYSRAVFSWLAPLLMMGYKRLLHAKDLFTLDGDMDPAILNQRFWGYWGQSSSIDTIVKEQSQALNNCKSTVEDDQKNDTHTPPAPAREGNSPAQPPHNSKGSQGKGQKSSNHRLILSCVLTLRRSLLKVIAPRLVALAFSICQPLVLNRFLEFLSDTSQPDNYGYGLVAAYGLVYLGIALSQALYWYCNGRFVSMLRSVLVSAVYQKLTEIPASNDDAAPLTLMSSDVDIIGRAMRQIHEIWANTIQIAIATWLLSTHISWAASGPIVVSLLALIATLLITPLGKKTQGGWLEKTQARISTTSALVGSMKSIKSSGLSEKISDAVAALRVAEVAASRPFRIIGAVTSSVAQIPVLVSPVVAFAMFQGVSQQSGQVLNATRLFAALSLVILLAQPLFLLFETVMDLASALAAFERIEAFLSTPGRADVRQLLRDTPEITVAGARPEVGLAEHELAPGLAIEVANASFSWSSEHDVLRDLSFNVKKGQLAVLIGSVASGKTTLLKGLLGEVSNVKGTIKMGDVSMSWCAQAPWIFNQTIRANIVSFSAMDQALYDQVVKACDLEKDLDSLPDGDMTRVGSKGLALSGGQKQRIALARALYSRPRMAFFDDILSGLDNHTASRVFRNVFGPEGKFRQWGTTVILATQSVHLIPATAWIIALENGTISEQGTFDQLTSSDNGGGYTQTITKAHRRLASSPAPEDVNNRPELTTDEEVQEVVAKAKKEHKLNDEKQSTDKRRQLGDKSVYKYYFGSIGLAYTLILLGLEIGWAFLEAFPTVWLNFWAGANEDDTGEDAGYYLGIYAALQILGVFWFAALIGFVLIFIATRSGIYLHHKLLHSVIRAPWSLFTKTDLGTITTRFSQDIGIIDNSLPLGLVVSLASFFGVLAKAALLASSSYYVAVSFPFLGFLYYYLQRGYLRTSRQLRLLDLEQKAPLYTQFLETASGLTTIRAFGWTDQSIQDNHARVAKSQQPFFLLIMVQKWLVLVLDLTTTALALLVVGFAVYLRDSVSIGLTGVALVQLISMSETLSQLIQFWTSIETSISAVARIKQFAEETPDENLPGESGQVPANWPDRGGVTFDNVSASYGEDEQFKALDGFSLDIQPGEKVGICGRTGSGKSSLLLTLLRLLEPSTGTITIDSLPLTSLLKESVRSHLIAITQDQYILPGTIRQNIDPYETSTAEDIESALRAVDLWQNVVYQGGLDVKFTGEMLSHGQKQLFFVARAILRKNVGRLVLLDEATSGIDQHTENMVLKTINEHFREHTVIAIAHRLNSIIDFDKVVVLDQGRAVEAGKPKELLKVGGRFKALWDSASG